MGDDHVSVGVARLFLLEHLGVFACPTQLPVGDEEISNVDVRFVVIGVNLERATEFGVGLAPFLQHQIALGQLVVGGGKVCVHVGGVAELNDGLAILAFGKIALAAFKVLLLAHIGVARASREKASHRYQ